MTSLAMAAAVLLVEGLVGYPAYLQLRIGHPVQWIGALIAYLDEGHNDPDASVQRNQINGAIALAAVLVTCVAPAILLATLLMRLPLGWILNILLATGALVAGPGMKLLRALRQVIDWLSRLLTPARALTLAWS